VIPERIIFVSRGITVIICVNNSLDQCVVTTCVVLRAVSLIYTHRASLLWFLAFVFWRLYDVEFFFSDCGVEFDTVQFGELLLSYCLIKGIMFY